LNYLDSTPQNKQFLVTNNDVFEKIKQYNQQVADHMITCLIGPCSRCNNTPDHFRRHELRKRQFRVIADEIVHFVLGLLIRWKCPGCNKSFTQYPDFALPYKRYILPDMMRYAERYLEDEQMSYSRLVIKWVAGYERHPGDESQLWPSTIHRWISTIGGLRRVYAKAQEVIHQKNPSSGLTRYLAKLTVSCRKFKTVHRQNILTACLRIVHVERIFNHIFQTSIFFKIAPTYGYS